MAFPYKEQKGFKPMCHLPLSRVLFTVIRSLFYLHLVCVFVSLYKVAFLSLGLRVTVSPRFIQKLQINKLTTAMHCWLKVSVFLASWLPFGHYYLLIFTFPAHHVLVLIFLCFAKCMDLFFSFCLIICFTFMCK